MGIAMQNTIEGTCIVCDHFKEEGMYIYTSFICRECELDIIQTNTSDSKYKYYLKRLKKVTKPEIYY